MYQNKYMPLIYPDSGISVTTLELHLAT